MKKSLIALAALCAGLAVAASSAWAAPPGAAAISSKDVSARGELRVKSDLGSPFAAQEVRAASQGLSVKECAKLVSLHAVNPQAAPAPTVARLCKGAAIDPGGAQRAADVSPISLRPRRYLT